MFSVVNRGQLNGTTEHEFENLNSRLKGLWLTEHNEDGTHNIAAIDFSGLRLQAGNISSGVFDTSLIPNLDASKITSGTFTAARIPNLDASKITTGTLSDSRLSTNVALLNVANTFSQNQLVSKTRPEFQLLTSGSKKGRLIQTGVTTTSLSQNLSYDGTNYNLDDTSDGGAILDITPTTLQLSQATSGANPRTLSTRFKVDNNGLLYEQGRSTAVGGWSTWTPTLSANVGTWTGGTTSGRYALIGNVCVIYFDTENSTLSGAATILTIGGLPQTIAQSFAGSILYFQGGAWHSDGILTAASASTQFFASKNGGGAFTAAGIFFRAYFFYEF